MEKFNIIPKQLVAENIEAVNAGDAVIEFATKMDSDMNSYFKAVPADDTTSEIATQIAALIRANQFSADECSNIFTALINQREVLGGKLWTTEDVRSRLAEITNGEAEIPQEVIDEVCNQVEEDAFCDCNEDEWNAIDDAIKEAGVRVTVTGIEYDIDEDDFDSEEEYKEFLEDNELPKEMTFPVTALEEREIADYISDNTEFFIKDGYSIEMTA